MSSTNPQTYQEWLDAGYTGRQSDFERWQHDMDALAERLDIRILGLQSNRRSGIITVPALTGSVFVPFSSPISALNYRVFFNVEGPVVTLRLSYSNQTLNGFTLNITGIGTAVAIAYLAIVDR